MEQENYDRLQIAQKEREEKSQNLAEEQRKCIQSLEEQLRKQKRQYERKMKALKKRKKTKSQDQSGDTFVLPAHEGFLVNGKGIKHYYKVEDNNLVVRKIKDSPKIFESIPLSDLESAKHNMGTSMFHIKFKNNNGEFLGKN